MSDTPIRMYGTVSDSIVDGSGLRFSVFVQGCEHHCPGCHNPNSQPDDGGYLTTVGEICRQIEADTSATGVTFSGGEPMLQPGPCAEIARWAKARGMDLWVYSGYLLEQILSGIAGDEGVELLDLCDVLVDGPFVQEKKSYELQWKGSSNQRVIDLAKTRQRLGESFAQFCEGRADGDGTVAEGSLDGIICLWTSFELDFEVPEHW